MGSEVNTAPRGAAAAAPVAVEFRFTQTESFAGLLRQLGGSLLVSTYQANKLLAVPATTDVRDGCRAGKATGGVLVDVPSGETVARGLRMPHSPRWHAGRLWVLDTVTWRLLAVYPGGRCEPVAEVPGYARGLAIVGRLAF